MRNIADFSQFRWFVFILRMIWHCSSILLRVYTIKISHVIDIGFSYLFLIIDWDDMMDYFDFDDYLCYARYISILLLPPHATAYHAIFSYSILLYLKKYHAFTLYIIQVVLKKYYKHYFAVAIFKLLRRFSKLPHGHALMQMNTISCHYAHHAKNTLRRRECTRVTRYVAILRE
jgi:hypothetical protein